jgi:hypothetical protein
LIRGSTVVNAVNAIDIAGEFFRLAGVAKGDDNKMEGRTMEGMKMKNGRMLYPDNALLKLLVQANPGRLGTKAHKFFEIARGAETSALTGMPAAASSTCIHSRAAASWRLLADHAGGPILADRAPRPNVGLTRTRVTTVAWSKRLGGAQKDI